MLHNRIVQFLILYICGIFFLLSIKFSLNLSDYVIPSLYDFFSTGKKVLPIYMSKVLVALFLIGLSIALYLTLLEKMGNVLKRKL